MPKVSVIVPIYNVEKYIERSLVSLFSQTLDSIEYIFVNDCTPDRSMAVLAEVLERFSHRKEQVRIVNLEENKGQAEVRKIGLLKATGDYIIQCDSDDWIAEDMYECMYNLAISKDYDVVRCNFCRTTDNIDTPCFQIPAKAYQDTHLLMSYLLRQCDLSSTCDKLVRREIYQSADFVFPQDNMCEDLAMTVQILCKAKNVGYIEDCLYHYFQDNSASISHSISMEHICKKADQIARNISLAQRVLEKKGWLNDFCDELVATKLLAKDALKPFIGVPEIYGKWLHCFKEINSKVVSCKYVTLKEKVAFATCYLKIYPFLKRYI